MLAGLETSDGKASTLGFYEIVLGRPGSAFERLETTRRITASDLLRVARRYLLPDDANRVFRNALNDVLRNGLVPKDAFAKMFMPEAAAKLKADFADVKEVVQLADFIAGAGKRGVLPDASKFKRSRRGGGEPEETAE